MLYELLKSLGGDVLWLSIGLFLVGVVLISVGYNLMRKRHPIWGILTGCTGLVMDTTAVLFAVFALGLMVI